MLGCLALRESRLEIALMTSNENRPPCLYLLWPRQTRDVPEALVPEGYNLRVYRDGDALQFLDLQSKDGEPMNDHQWRHYLDALLPNGLFLVTHVKSTRLVGTAGAIHNPNPGRYYFPFGGELGYLIVAPDHRRLGLGRAVCAAVVKRLLSAGYENIRVCVQEHRLAAIGTYLRLGFEPFLHSAQVKERWRRVYEAMNLEFTPKSWPRAVE